VEVQMMCTTIEVIDLAIVISMTAISPEIVATPIIQPEKPGLITTMAVETIEVVFLEDLEKERLPLQ
jgi:hypothetical protein